MNPVEMDKALDIPLDVKKLLLNEELKRVKNSLYAAIVRLQVSKAAGIEQVEKTAQEESEKLKKMVDGYEEQIKLLDKKEK